MEGDGELDVAAFPSHWSNPCTDYAAPRSDAPAPTHANDSPGQREGNPDMEWSEHTRNVLSAPAQEASRRLRGGQLRGGFEVESGSASVQAPHGRCWHMTVTAVFVVVLAGFYGGMYMLTRRRVPGANTNPAAMTTTPGMSPGGGPGGNHRHWTTTPGMTPGGGPGGHHRDWTVTTTRAAPVAPNIVNLTVITWNQGFILNTTALMRRLEATNADVAVVCQQETSSSAKAPSGWERIYKKKMLGMTKPGFFASQYLTVFRRHRTFERAAIVVDAPRHGSERVSMSGKGSIWVELQIHGADGCANVAVVCAHLPTAPEERHEGLVKVLADVAEEYNGSSVCNSKGVELPLKGCWGSLHSVFLTGDLNYRLGGNSPEFSDAELAEWLRTGIRNRRWPEMLSLDTLPNSTLLSAAVGFSCNMPHYPPSYKVQSPAADCSGGDYENCLLPPGGGLHKKGTEIQLGWLDRVCWLHRDSRVALVSDEWLYNLAGGSDHVPMQYIFEITHLNATCSNTSNA